MLRNSWERCETGACLFCPLGANECQLPSSSLLPLGSRTLAMFWDKIRCERGALTC